MKSFWVGLHYSCKLSADLVLWLWISLQCVNIFSKPWLLNPFIHVYTWIARLKFTRPARLRGSYPRGFRKPSRQVSCFHLLWWIPYWGRAICILSAKPAQPEHVYVGSFNILGIILPSPAIPSALMGRFNCCASSTCEAAARSRAIARLGSPTWGYCCAWHVTF